jgi:hypothetical protein
MMSRSDPLAPPPEFLRELEGGPEFEGSPSTPKTTTRTPPPPATLSPKRRPGIAATPPGPPQPLMVLLGTPVVLHLRSGESMRGRRPKMGADRQRADQVFPSGAQGTITLDGRPTRRVSFPLEVHRSWHSVADADMRMGGHEAKGGTA